VKLLHGRRESDSDSHILGLVINGFDVKKADQYYYSYYNYYPSDKEQSNERI